MAGEWTELLSAVQSREGAAGQNPDRVRLTMNLP